MTESNFVQKIGAACNKKEDLYKKSKTRYAVRSMFAGGFLTLSTAVGASCSRRPLKYFFTRFGEIFISIYLCLGSCLSSLLKYRIDNFEYDVFNSRNLSKEN